MHHRPWDAARRTELPRLRKDLRADVAVVGAGITGLMTAYLLARAGKRVAVLEREPGAGRGDSGSTTAMATLLPDVPLARLRRTFGKRRAAEALAAGQRAIDLLENVARKERIDCEFVRCPVRVHAAAKEDAEGLRKDAETARALGFRASFWKDGLDFERHGFLEMPGQAKFHPGKLLQGLAKAVLANGGEIYVSSPVTKFGGRGGTVVVTPAGKVAAKHVVVATHAPVDDPYEAPMRMKAWRTYVIAAEIPAGTVPEGIYWDTYDPYRYFRVDRLGDADRIILGGEDHPVGRDPERDPYPALETHLTAIVGTVPRTVTHRWSGEVYETADGLPFIGRSIARPKHSIATGFAGNGMAYGTLAASLIAADLLGSPDPRAAAFSPLRAKALSRIAAFGAAVFQDYVLDHLRLLRRPGPPAPGDGRVAIVNGKRAAVSRGRDGRVVAVSAVCTHLGCLVRWNSLEASWDCPCHGSRFTAEGEVLNGPAIEPLERLPDVERKFRA